MVLPGLALNEPTLTGVNLLTPTTLDSHNSHNREVWLECVGLLPQGPVAKTAKGYYCPFPPSLVSVGTRLQVSCLATTLFRLLTGSPHFTQI